MDSQLEQVKQFLHAVYERRRLFIIVAASVALLAVFSTFFRDNVYEAKSTVFIERNVINNLMKGITVSPSMDDRIRVLRYYILSRDMVTRALKKMDMDSESRYLGTGKFEGLVLKCQQNTDISVRGSDLFFISMVDQDPEFAMQFINTLVSIYVEENLSDKREESYGANRFLAEQVAFYKQKLDEIDTKIIDFRRETGIYSSVNETTVMREIEEEEAALKLLRGEKKQANAMIKTMKQQLDTLRKTSSSSTSSFDFGIDFDVDISSVNDQRIADLESRIEELLLVYNDQYPTVVKLRDQIEELRKRQEENPDPIIEEPAPITEEASPQNYNPLDDPIYVDLKMRLNTAQSDFNALVAKEKELEASISANQELLRNFPEDKKALNDLERERVMQASIYEELLQRVGVAEVSKQMEVADKATTFRVVDPAILPTKPVGTKRIMLMFLGALGGIACGFGVVVVVEHLNGSIKGTKQIKDLGVTVLVEIPFIWHEEAQRLMWKKDKAVFSFAAACSLLIGFMMLHDLIGLSVIDDTVAYLLSKTT